MSASRLTNRWYEQARRDDQRRRSERERKARWRARQRERAARALSELRRRRWLAGAGGIAAALAVALAWPHETTAGAAGLVVVDPTHLQAIANRADMTADGVNSIEQGLAQQQDVLSKLLGRLDGLGKDVQVLKRAADGQARGRLQFVRATETTETSPPPAVPAAPPSSPAGPERIVVLDIQEGGCLRETLQGLAVREGWHLEWDVPGVEDVCDLSPAALSGDSVVEVIRKLKRSLRLSQALAFHAWPDDVPPKLLVTGSGEDAGGRLVSKGADQ